MNDVGTAGAVGEPDRDGEPRARSAFSSRTPTPTSRDGFATASEPASAASAGKASGISATDEVVVGFPSHADSSKTTRLSPRVGGLSLDDEGGVSGLPSEDDVPLSAALSQASDTAWGFGDLVDDE